MVGSEGGVGWCLFASWGETTTTRLLKIPSSLGLNTSKDGASTTCLHNLCLTTLTMKNFFLIQDRIKTIASLSQINGLLRQPDFKRCTFLLEKIILPPTPFAYVLPLLTWANVRLPGYVWKEIYCYTDARQLHAFQFREKQAVLVSFTSSFLTCIFKVAARCPSALVVSTTMWCNNDSRHKLISFSSLYLSCLPLLAEGFDRYLPSSEFLFSVWEWFLQHTASLIYLKYRERSMHAY